MTPSTITDLHLQEQIHYEFTWNEDVQLLRQVYPNAKWEGLIDFENSLRLFTVGGFFGTRGGEAEFAFILEDACVVGIAETRDFAGGGHGESPYPLWGNARVVPTDHPLYNQIQQILTALRGG